MVARRPLVIDGGSLKELPSGDSIAGDLQDLSAIAATLNLNMVSGCIDCSENPPLSVQKQQPWFAVIGALPENKAYILEQNSFNLINLDGPLPILQMQISGSAASSGFSFFHAQAFYLVSLGTAKIAALNGFVALVIPAANTNGGVRIIDWARNRILRSFSGAIAGRVGYLNTITDVANKAVAVAPMVSLTGNHAQSVTMRVRSGAPLDRASGLPLPTLAIGTNGGIDLFDDPATLAGKRTISHTSIGAVGAVEFLDDDLLFYSCETSISYVLGRWQHVVPIPSDDVTYGHVYAKGAGVLETYTMRDGYSGTLPLAPTSAANIGASALAANIDRRYFGRTDGLFVFDKTNMRAVLNTDVATPLLFGDCKLSVMNGPAGVDLDGSLEDINGDFTDASGWTVGEWTVGAGVAEIVNAPASTNYLIGYVSEYVKDSIWHIEIDIDDFSAGTGVEVRLGASASGEGVKTFTSAGVHAVFAKWTGSGSIFFIRQNTINQSARLNSIKLRRAAPDHSIYANPLIIQGTVPVDDDGWYGPFGSDDYLEQTPNDDLNFGTGDFCFGFEADVGGGGAMTAFSSSVLTALGAYFTGGQLALYVNSGAFLTGGRVYTDKGPHSFWVQRISGTVSVWVDGELEFTISRPSTVVINLGLRLGLNFSDLAPAVNVKLRRFQIGSGYASAEQIKAMCRWVGDVIPGTSDAILSMDFNGETGLLWCLTSDRKFAYNHNMKLVHDEPNTANETLIVSDGLFTIGG